MYSVLYVDDEPALLELAKVFLERTHDFTLIPKISAEEGLEVLKQANLDAIISDYQMPEKNGIQFLKEVRAQHGDIPFILFTGKGREDVVIDAINNGADFYLQKGGHPTAQFAELAHKIRTAIEHKSAGHSLHESEQRQADIINFLPDATFAINASGTVIAWNRAMEDMTGVKKEDMLGRGNYEYGIPFYGERRPLLADLVISRNEEIEKLYPDRQQKNDSLISEMFVPRIYGGRGAYLWFIASPLYDTKGNIIGAIEGIRDISDRKNIELSLAESEQRYRAVVEDQTEFICRFTPDGTHNFVNEAYCRFFGKKREEIIGKKFTPRIPVEDQPGVRKHFAALTRENPTATIIHRIEMDNGEIRWHRWSDRAIFDTRGVITEYQSVGRDITGQKLTEMELSMKRDYLDQIYSSVKAGILIIDAKTHDIIDVNPMAVEMIGAKKDQILGKVCHRFICPAEWGNCPITDKGLPVDNSERVLLTSDGRKKSIIKYVTPTVLDGHNVLLETFIDNTPRKQAEEELQAAYFQLSAAERELQQKYEELHKSKEILRESEKAYRTIFENTGTATMILDEDKTILLFNGKCEEISGYTKAEIEGKRKWTEFVDKENLQKMVSYNNERWKSPETVPSQYEFKFIAKNSDIKSVILSIGLIPGTRKAVASLLDITGYKKIEQEIRASEEKFRSLVANSLNGIIIIDFTGKLLFANPYAGHIIGGDQYPALFGKYNVLDLLLPEFRGRAVLDFAKVLAGTDGYLVNYKIATPSSGEMWIECIGKKIMYEGSFAVLLSINDITERIKAQEALRESEKKFRFLTEKINDMVWTVDMGLRCTYVSPSITKLLGFSPEERMEQNIEEQVTPESVTVIQEILERERENEKSGLADPDRSVSLELEYFHKDGSVRWMESIVSGIRDNQGKLIGFHGVSRDISERKKTEAALMESEEKFRSLVNHSLEGILILDLEGRVLFANNAAARTIEADDSAALLGRNVMEFIAPESREEVVRDFMQVAQGHDAFLAKYSVISVKGKKIRLESIGKIIQYGGKTADLISIRDITESEKAVDALRESEEKFRRIMEQVPDIVSIFNRDGVLLFNSPAACRIHGYDEADLIGNNTFDFIHPDDRELVAQKFQALLTSPGSIQTAQYRYRNKDGTYVWMEAIGRFHPDASGQPQVVSISRDISNRKQTEYALYQANNKLTLLNNVTRHDILNQLLVLSGNLELAQKHMNDDAAQKKYLEKAAGAASMIEQLITFTRDYQGMGLQSPVWQNISDVLAKAAKSLNMGSVKVIFDRTDIEILSDPLTEKVWYNLLDNSLRHGGNVTAIHIAATESDNNLILVYEDDGAGIPAQLKTTVFEPGYGKNTGYGLFFIREILGLSGITIRETGEPGNGVRFEITVPKEAYRSTRSRPSGAELSCRSQEIPGTGQGGTG